MTLHPLDLKLVRDAWRLRGQLLAAAMVMAAGLAVLVLTQYVFATLSRTQETYYAEYRFADVFAGVRRAPESVAADLRAIPGVTAVETRIAQIVQVEGANLPPLAALRLVSLPDFGEPAVNLVRLSAGRFPAPRRGDEVVLSQGFADANALGLDDAVTALINGRRQALRVVGIGDSPEFVYVVAPGDFLPIPARFGVGWMSREALATAFDRDGAFNDVALLLGRGAREGDVVDAVDDMLARYGGAGSTGRDDQPSHAFLQGRIDSLQAAGRALPIVFLGVAVFMLNAMLARLVETEREQIGLMKAFGYSNAEVAGHYAKLALVPAGVAALVGISGGLALGQIVSEVQAQFFSLPLLDPDAPAWVIAAAILAAVAAALAGALGAARGAARLDPAVAMRPPAPARFSAGLIERLRLERALSVPVKIIVRNIERRPLRALLTAVGVSGGMALMIGTTFLQDSMLVMLDNQFGEAQRHDVTLAYVFERPDETIGLTARLPGVLQIEPVRTVPVEVCRAHRCERTGLQGLPGVPDLNRPIDANRRPIPIPPEGIVVSQTFADALGARAGEVLRVDTLEGRRRSFEVLLVGTAEDYVGQAAYMRLEALNRAMGDGGTVTGAVVTLDPVARDAFDAAVIDAPAIQNASDRAATVAEVRSLLDQGTLLITVVYTAFSGLVGFGVVYNAARIALSERGRELASLRVLGFSRTETSLVLLGELGVLVALALPLGAAFGYGLASLVTQLFNAELIRLPLIVTPGRLAFGAGMTLLFAAVAGAIVRRRIDRLDLIAVLKTRE